MSMVKSVGRGGASLGSPDWLAEFARDLLVLGLGETGGVGRFGTKKKQSNIISNT